MRFALLTLLIIINPNVISARSTIEQLLKKITRRTINGNGIFPSLAKNYRHASPSEMIEQENYSSETHHITTEDGYSLTVHRIPGPSNSTPVLLQHGLLESSADWLLLGKKRSLAYILSRHGYDVWLGNARGNTYSRSHQNLSTSDPQFWNFSWEQMGQYDLPAVIAYIAKLKQDSLFYIGHSMGCTTFSVMAIERPDVAKKVKAMIALAPATYVYHMENVLKVLAPFWKEIQDISNSMGIYELMPHNGLFDVFAKYICNNVVLKKLCGIPLSSFAGFNPKKVDTSLLPKIWRNFPSGTSMKLFIHYLQQINLNKLRKFDYGPQTNLRVYRTRDPPLFDLSKLRVPVAVFWSANDKLVGPEDEEKFYNEVPLKLGIFKVKDEKYNHFDFLWAVDAPQLVYDKVTDIMKSYNGSIH